MTPHQTQNEPRVRNVKKTEPVRQCAVTRGRLGQSELLRFACGPEGQLVPDLAQRLPGRGVWVRPQRTVVEAGLKRGTFQRALSCSSEGFETLCDTVERLLVQKCQGTLGLAKRAGKITLGFDQVRARLRQAAPGVLIEAANGSADGRNKVYSLAKALYSGAEVAGALSSSELGMALGRDHVIHALLERGPFARTWRLDYARLSGFRPVPEDNWFSVVTRQEERSTKGVDQV